MLALGNIGKYSTHLTPTFKWGVGSNFQQKLRSLGLNNCWNIRGMGQMSFNVFQIHGFSLEKCIKVKDFHTLCNKSVTLFIHQICLQFSYDFVLLFSALAEFQSARVVSHNLILMDNCQTF